MGAARAVLQMWRTPPEGPSSTALSLSGHTRSTIEPRFGRTGDAERTRPQPCIRYEARSWLPFTGEAPEAGIIDGMSDLIIAACDGAAKKNPGPAGWGWVVADAAGTPQRWEAGALGVATNNVAELTALAELLESTDASVPLEVRMDSKYAMQAVTTWIKNWKRNGWLTASKKPVANRELVIRIDELLTGREVTFKHVAAHQVDGDLLNAIADIAASDAAESQQPAGTAHGNAAIPEPRADRVTAAPAARKSAAPRKSATGASGKAPVIKAKFAGRCSCGKPYAQGEKITKLASGGWGHVECAGA